MPCIPRSLFCHRQCTYQHSFRTVHSFLIVLISNCAGRPAGRPDVRPDVRAARVSSAVPKKKSFDRGGPVWPPRSNVTNDRLGVVLGGLCPPSQNLGGLGGSAPQPKPKNFENFPIFTPHPAQLEMSALYGSCADMCIGDGKKDSLECKACMEGVIIPAFCAPI